MAADRAPSLPRRLLAEGLGTALLVAVVVGSGIAAQRLSPSDTGLQLLENSLATALALTVLIAWLGPVSGAHFNPAVSLAAWWWGRPGGERPGTGLDGRDVPPYVAAQLAGGLAGSVLAAAMFELPLVDVSTTERVGSGTLVGEVVATFGLVALVGALVAGRREHLAAPLVGAYIGAAYWWTSSTSFANPAVTLGRSITDTFAGIAPSSVPPFVLAQLVGATLALAAIAVLHPVRDTDALVPPHDHAAEESHA
ncbi:MAG: MIP/aquaporin family protein [Actinomycetes bacterium]